MRVFVYFNLHKRVFSVKALEGENKGRVVAHRAYVALTDVVFKVSEAGRQRVIAEQRKNVHAGATGHWTDESIALDDAVAVTYNPYKYSSFVVKSTEMPVRTAHRAVLHNKTIMAEIG